ncbi:5-methyltetrahydropteroyltriglutamate--homocysteine S-methyltransferase [Gordonia sp. X0973]|uniref:5-methyltetrahydropteroyltriglutamate-- homocysteine S-methyltransferase n=1 Tax=Gordonia sp. X0973 TaxID=2742602 RepID=UPI000F54105D|nr:5-methyltetrahydropteroyltriglutamate--homocysteine S-methyltransferase [Gordonia sp. X0973]QKT06773.1 5-methyltetrahydropteroyltriglutamate--homocysteine S-methyltransferase [Gordonia sp. X0973]
MSSDTTPTTNRAPDFTATVGGTARIGPNRELKRAIEGYWKGNTDRASLEAVAASLRGDTARSLRDAGFDSIPVNTFSYYDQMLDTAIMLGALAPRFASVDDDLNRYFAAARGTAELTPLEMTKWFDTNYHYLVPELSAQTTYRLDASKVLAEWSEAANLGVDARPVVIGPITFLGLAKSTDETAPFDRIDEVVEVYEQLLGELAAAGVKWVQIDEPVLCTDIVDNADGVATAAEVAGSVYQRLSGVSNRPAIFVNTYFGDPGAQVLSALAHTDVEAIGVDLVYGSADTVAAVPALSSKLLVAGVVNGRNIWRTDLDAALATLGTLLGSARAVAVSTSCSTLHVPYSLEPETELDDNLRGWLAFAAEKFVEVATLATALNRGRDAVADRFEASAAALAIRATDPRVKVAAVRDRLTAVTEDELARGESSARLAAQQERLNLPLLPTTTIGSYPQTGEIRKARAALRTGEIDDAEYTRRMKAEIDGVIELQEQLGLDVLVHGEPERNDMVQYFAEQLDGFFATQNGWVQSYGTRCVRPPILFGDVVRQTPMTVDWITYAQSKTEKPVKGMLTGPVTILAWSFVRDDQPEKDSANQIALAIRDETVDLEKAGIGVIQVDEPALRELLPLRDADKPEYLRWAVDAFRLSTAGVEDTTQIHTHLCYSEFGEVIGAIADLDADVTSIEAARSAMEVLDDLNAVGFANGVGPGVYDIHSPRVPSTDEITASLQAALKAVPAQRLWVNPDCGLKTRGNEEVTASLRNMVDAAKAVRPAANA